MATWGELCLLILPLINFMVSVSRWCSLLSYSLLYQLQLVASYCYTQNEWFIPHRKCLILHIVIIDHLYVIYSLPLQWQSDWSFDGQGATPRSFPSSNENNQTHRFHYFRFSFFFLTQVRTCDTKKQKMLSLLDCITIRIWYILHKLWLELLTCSSDHNWTCLWWSRWALFVNINSFIDANFKCSPDFISKHSKLILLDSLP